MSGRNPPRETPAPIAIIGMACIFPQAPDLATYWNNILNGVDAIGEPVPDWGAERYLGAGRIRTQRGGFLKDLYRFDPREFGIMPNSVDGGETDQYLALRVARDALADSGYLKPDADHHATGIVLGHSAYLHRGQVTVIQNNIVLDQTMDLLRTALPHMSDGALGEIREILRRKLPPTTADNAPGLVPNMMTGRIANRLNLRGPNYVLDAACASSLLAVAAAADELRSGRSDMMLAGGVNATLPADVTTSFTQLGALSARGRVRPFEKGSDGTLLGEGLGVVVLKRLEDAIADGDRVYAVLRGVGHSSDGRGAGLLAPSQDGETLAIRRAYELTGIDPDTVDLVEAHGTGIPLGDQTEIASLKSVFGDRKAGTGTKALGSVKSMISHCIPGAGIAGLIKMALSLHHRVLPPTLCDEVNPDLGIQETPFYVNTRPAPWIARPGVPRRAAVNSFGFGGINAHAIVEQAPTHARAPGRLTCWPSELCVMSGDSVETLVQKLERLVDALAANPQWSVAEVAAALAREDRNAEHRIAILARDVGELTTNIALAIGKVREGAETLGATRARVVYGRRRMDGKLGFIFPGEGSQYPGMFADVAVFPEVQRWLDFWHALYGLPDGQTRTDIVFPTCEVGPERRAELEKRLHDMDVGSEAVFIGGMAMFDLLGALGVSPDVMVGHSSGESSALAASGANPATSDAELAACIAKHYAAYDGLLKSDKIPTGALLTVGALPLELVESEISALGGEVQVAMDNCSNQQVLYGSREAIDRIEQALTKQGGICMRLPFDRGYHTPAFEDASRAFLAYYEDIKVGRPLVPLYSCATAGRFPDASSKVRKLAAQQWSRKVRFRETIAKMHEDGVRIFLEVGPSGNLVSFVNDILAGREFLALPTNIRRRNGIEQLLSVLGWLYALGRWDALDKLYGPREIAAIDLDGRKPKPLPPLLDNTMPMVRLAPSDRERISELVAAPTRNNAYAAAAADPRAALGNLEDVSANDYTEENETGWTDGPDEPDTLVRSSHANDSATPLLDVVLEHDEDHVVALCRVSLDNDQFVRDHVLSGPVSVADPALTGLPCVPFMVSMELMAEACALLAGRTDISVIENVRAFDWITLDDGALDIQVRAELIDRESGRYRAAVTTPRGTAVTGEFSFSRSFELGPVAPLAQPRAWNIDKPSLYTPGRYAMFHGPVFQSVRAIDAWDDTGLDVALSEVSLEGFFEPGHIPRLVLNPVLLDALSQVVPCWLVQYVGPEFHSFPSAIDRIELYESCPADREGVVIRARQEPADPANDDITALRNWQFGCIDGEGRVLMRGRALGNLFFRVSPTYHAVRTHPGIGMLGAPVPSPETGVDLWEVPLIEDKLFLQSGGICARVLAHVLLGAAEREEWRALEHAGLPRRREWLTGRAAIKEAVRHWVYECTGQLLYPADIEVCHDEAGAPFVGGWWCDSLIEAPRVSLAHDADSCIAAVAAPDEPVGVDLERIDRRRRSELIVGSMADEEKSLMAGLTGEAHEERVLRVWCAKEAASKCLGTGLRGEPWAFRIVAADPALDRCEVAHAAGTVAVTIEKREAAIIAIGTLAAQQLEAHA
ncbi:MAG TPA: beta-ketoacyl synthase N-terminal-like domain-containing protein [Rhodanobacteraceae bacterium]|nr:beta-ketoacyl synthase N-terminal-like domain-containing protein [Rhodanobacteraceae bacterium]